MSAILSAGFGSPAAVRAAAIGNATFERALHLGYSRITAYQFARQAKREATEWERPSEVALRIVRPRSHSATVPGPFGGNAA